MTNSGVAPEWIERLETVGSPPDSRIGIMPPPLSRPYLTGQAHLIQDLDGAKRLVQACLESPVSWIGIDTEFRYESEHPMYVQKTMSTHRKEVWDIRTIHPFCLAFAVVSRMCCSASSSTCGFQKSCPLCSVSSICQCLSSPTM